MKNNIEIEEDSDINFLEEYYPERPLSEKETIELDRNIGKKILSGKKNILKVISHLKALSRYMMDKDVKWYRKSIVVAALVYFVTPFDAMPDFAPFVGYLDDIGVIAWTVKFLGSEITSYYD
ncbi:MAG: YkvA family protein [Ignavibacteria bacterium]